MIDPELKKIYEEIIKERKKNLYENFCSFSRAIIKIKLSGDRLENEKETIQFSRLKIEPGANISASAIFFLISFLIPISLLYFFNFFQYFIYVFVISGFISFLIYYYPHLKMKVVRASASSEMVLCITYMTISLSQVPNLENAVVFAYKNLAGPIKKDLEDLIIKFFEGQIFNFKDGLNYIADKWYKEGKEFSEALKLLISYSENSYENETMLDTALNMIVDDSYFRMEKYARELRLPTTAIVVLGIILPVIGLVLIPMLTIFLPEMLDMFGVFFIYDIFLPFILFFLITFVMEGRPLTTSPIILENPLETEFFGRSLNILIPLSLIAIILIFYFGNSVYQSSRNYQLCTIWAKNTFSSEKMPENLKLNVEECKAVLSDLLGSSLYSLLLLFSVAFTFSIPLLFITQSPIKKRDKIRKVESELPMGLLEIGYGVKAGKPFEVAILKSVFKSTSFETTKLFNRLKENISLGYTVKGAVFDDNVGIVKYYNSALLHSIFKVIIDVSEKGTIYLHKALITFSGYLRTVTKLQNKIDDMISESVSTLKFMAFVLTPIVSGVAISLAMIILGILSALLIKLGGILPTDASGIPSIGMPFIDLFGASTVSPSIFQLAIGIYLLEMCIIYGIFINGLENGFDYVVGINYISKIIIISMLIFVSVSVIIYLSLSGLMASLIEIGV